MNRQPAVEGYAPKIVEYHHSGTCGYLDISRAWMSGCSDNDRLLCIHICFLKYRMVCMIVAVMLAKLRPYDTANVVLSSRRRR